MKTHATFRTITALLLLALSTAPQAAPADAAPSGDDTADTDAELQAAPIRRLQQARAAYQRHVRDGGWQAIEHDDLIEEGDTHEVVPQLRARLTATGDLEDTGPDDEEYDAELAAAVRGFQARHGLKIDGIIGPDTIAAMNVSAEDRLAQIERTLQEMKGADIDWSRAFVLVNVPEFRVRAFDGGREVLQQKVIVGAEYDGRTTPSFSDEIEYAIFRPYWMVPPSIAAEELVGRGPSALEADGFQIVRDYNPDSEPLAMTGRNLRKVARGKLRIRQAAGPDNALGLVKYIFPNDYAIYLHDTPTEHLFDKHERDFSHGCIRLEDPVAFGDFVLDRAEGDWSPERIERAMHEGGRQRVDLTETMPVHILYWTAYADDDGSINFREDIYGRH